METVANFDITLSDQGNGRFRVQAGGQEYDFAPEAAWQDSARQLFQAAAVQRAQAAAVGDALYAGILPPPRPGYPSPARAAYQELVRQVDLGQSPGCRLRLIFAGAAPTPATFLPWELLRRDGVHLGLDSHHSLVRYVPQPETHPEPLPRAGDFNILYLLLSSDPAWEAKMGAEVDRLQTWLGSLPAEGSLAFHLARLAAASQAELRAFFDQAVADGQRYHAVFVAGDCRQTAGGGAFQLPGDQAEYGFFSLYADLKRAMGNRLPPLLLGHTGAAATGQAALTDLACRLVGKGMPAAVVVPTPLGDAGTFHFVSTFLNALLANFPVDRAVVAGRARMLLEQQAPEERLRWPGFVLYSSVDDGILYQLPRPPAVEEEEEAAGPEVPGWEVAGLPPAAGGSRGHVTIFNATQIQHDPGGINAMGVGQIVVGSFNVLAAMSPPVSGEEVTPIGIAGPGAEPARQQVSIEVFLNLDLEAAPGNGGEQRLLVELDIDTHPRAFSVFHRGRETLTDITLGQLQQWAQELLRTRWQLHEGNELWSGDAGRALTERGQAFFRDMLQHDAAGAGQLEKALLIRSLYEARYQFVLNLQNGLLQSVPWEMLHDSKTDFLCLAHPLYRFLEPTVDMPPERLTGPIEKALVVAANPRQDLAEVDAEAQAIVAALQGAGLDPANITLIPSSEATSQAVENALAQGGYQLFHFAGHGQYDPSFPHQSSLWLGKPGQNVEEMRAEFLAGILPGSGLELAFLSACTSAQHEQDLAQLEHDEPWKIRGLAHAFAHSGIPAVIAMHWVLGDEAGKKLASAFYSRAGTFGYAEALRRARLATKDELVLDWANPVLAMRSW